MRDTIIYGLQDPETLELRYVGKSVNLKDRYYRHCFSNRSSDKSRKTNWIKHLKSKKLLPETIIIDIVPHEANWVEAERFWIAYFIFLGADLVNHTVGGEGSLGYRHTRNSRDKMRCAQQGKRGKLCSFDVVGIRDSWVGGGVTYDDLAIKYGVSCATIISVINNRTWRHVWNTPSQYTKLRKRTSSSKKGVYWRDRAQKWNARISVKGKLYSLGMYSTEAEATAARCRVENDIKTGVWVAPKAPKAELKSDKVGVVYDSKRRKWRASLCRDGLRLKSTYFASEQEAIAAREAMETNEYERGHKRYAYKRN